MPFHAGGKGAAFPMLRADRRASAHGSIADKRDVSQIPAIRIRLAFLEHPFLAERMAELFSAGSCESAFVLPAASAGFGKRIHASALRTGERRHAGALKTDLTGRTIDELAFVDAFVAFDAEIEGAAFSGSATSLGIKLAALLIGNAASSIDASTEAERRAILLRGAGIIRGDAAAVETAFGIFRAERLANLNATRGPDEITAGFARRAILIALANAVGDFLKLTTARHAAAQRSALFVRSAGTSPLWRRRQHAVADTANSLLLQAATAQRFLGGKAPFRSEWRFGALIGEAFAIGDVVAKGSRVTIGSQRTGISEAVAVGIALIGIWNDDAIVAKITVTIAVGVGLTGVFEGRAIVLRIDDAVVVKVSLGIFQGIGGGDLTSLASQKESRQHQQDKKNDASFRLRRDILHYDFLSFSGRISCFPISLPQHPAH